MTSEPIKPLSTTSRPKTAATWFQENKVRLLRFAGVGLSGTLVNLLVANLAIYFLFPPFFSDTPLFLAANGLGFVVSVFTNFIFNDRWTWGDREKGGRRQWFQRLTKFYITASGAGIIQILTAWLSLITLWAPLAPTAFGIDLSPSLSIMTGIGFGMTINFTVGHLWAFRDAS